MIEKKDHFLIGNTQRQQQGSLKQIALIIRQSMMAGLIGVALSSLCISANVYANPEGAEVTAGSATMSSPDANTLHIQQSSDKAVIDWRSFNIAPHEATIFQQPGTSSITLNRVNPQSGASSILGKLSANGHIWLINPAGVIIGSGARIDAAGLLATTAQISNADFMAGHYHFIQPSDWNYGIVSAGMITVSDKGLVALVAPGVEHSGVISANLGKIALASATEFTVDFYGDQLINFSTNARVDRAPINPATQQTMKDAVNVTDSGKLIANGGKILLTAQTAENVIDNAINMNGYVQAQSAYEKNGEVVLSGDSGAVQVGGTVNTTGKAYAQKGSNVKILGKKVTLTEKAKVDASGDVGGGEILIGGNYQGRGVEPNVDYVFVKSGAQIFSDALTNGDGGKIIVWSNVKTKFLGDIYARGGAISGNGGFVEVSGKETLSFNGYVNTLAAGSGKAGTLLLDPRTLTIVNSGGTLNLTDVDQFSDTPGTDGSINSSTINSAASNVILQANRDIIFNDSINMTGAGLSLTVQAARSIIVDNVAAGNISIATNNGAISMTANDSSSGASSTNRTTTAGSIIMNAGSSLNAGTGNITLTVDPSAASPFSPGSITAAGLTGNTISINSPNTITLNGAINATGTISINANTDGAGANSFTMGAGSSITTTDTSANAVSILVNAAAGGTGTAALRSITAGNGGTITVKTDTGSNVTGGDITWAAGVADQLDAGANGIIALSTPVITGDNIGATGAGQIRVTGGTVNATTGSSGLFINHLGTNVLSLGTINTSGGFTLNSTGSAGITNSGAITVTGITTIAAGSANDITLNNANNDFSTLTITSGNNVSVNDVNALTMGASTISGTLGVTTAGTQSIGALSVAGATAIFTSTGNNDITFSSTVNGATDLAVNTTGTTTFSGAVGATTPLKSITTNAGGITAINGGSINTSGGTGGQIFNDDVTLNANTTLSAGSGPITFAGKLNSLNSTARTLAVNTTDATTFNGIVGGNFALSTLTTNAGGTTTFNGGTVTTTSTQTYNDAVTLAVDSVFNTTNSAVSFASTVDRDGAARALTITAGSGAINLSGNVGAGVNGALGAVALNTTGTGTISGTLSAASLTTNTGGTTAINGGAITTTGAQTYNDAVTLNADTTLNAGSGAVNFVGTLNSANSTLRNLIVNSSGTTTFGGVVGGTNALASITTDSSGTTAINGGTITTSGAGGQVYNDAVTLNANTTLNAGTGPITFASTLDSLTTTARTLALNSSGTTTLSGSVGATNALSSITTDSSGSTAINGGSVRTAGSQTYNDAVSLNQDTTFTTTAAGSSFLLANTANNFTATPIFATSGVGTITTISLANASTTPALPTLSATPTNLALNYVNSAITLPALTLAGTLTVTSGGLLSQSGALVITGVTTLAAGTNNIVLTNAGNNFGTVTISNAADATLNDSDALAFGGTSNVTGTLTATAGGAISDTGSISANTLTTTSVGGTVLNFGHTVNNFNATNTTSGAITFINTASNLNITGISQSGTGTINLTNTGTLSIPDLVTLSSPNTAINLTATDLNLNSTGAISSGTAATTITQNTTSGTIGLGGATGTMSISNSELQRISAGNFNVIAANDGQILVDGISSTDTPNITGTITLTATAGTLGAITFQNNSSTFGRPLTLSTDNSVTVNEGVTLATNNGALSITALDLNLNSTGALSSGTAATTIAQNTTGVNIIELGNPTGIVGRMGISNSELQRISSGALNIIAASDGQILVDGITVTDTPNVTGTITLTATAGTLGSIIFQNNSSTFARPLTISTDNTVTVNDGVTLATNNGALSITALDLNLNSTGALNSGTATTTLTQNATGASIIELGNPTGTVGRMGISGSELQRMIAGALSIVAATNGQILVDGITAGNSANIAGTTTLNATAGTTGSITFQNNSSTFTNALTATTDNTFAVNDGVTLATNNAALSITALDLNLNSTGALNSGTATTSITQNATGTNIIELGNPTGIVGRMGISGSELQRITANNLNFVSSSNGQIIVDGISATNSGNINGVLTLNATAGNTSNIVFQNNASTFRTLTAQADNGITVNSGVNLTTTVGNLILDADVNASSQGSDALTLNADLTSAGAMTLTAATQGIVLGTPVNISGDGIIFSDAINGANALAVNSGSGSTIFQGIVGGSTPLSSLTVTGATTISTSAITTSGAQTYNNALTLGVNTTLTSNSSGNLNFASTVDGGFRLTANTAGNTIFGGAVGSVTPLSALITDSAGTTTINGSTITTSGAQTYSDAITLGAATTLTSTGSSITSNGAISGNSLTTSSATGTTLNAANTINIFNATNSTSGSISLVNTAPTLTIAGITQNSNGGNVTVTNTGTMTNTGTISAEGGNISLTTLSPDTSERVLTVAAPITTTSGGNITLTAANNSQGDANALVVNQSVTTTGGSGGTFTIGGGVGLNVVPSAVFGNITLQGNGFDLTLGTLNFAQSVGFAPVRNLYVTGNLTSSSGANINLEGGTGAVIFSNNSTVNSGGSLSILGNAIFGDSNTLTASNTISLGTNSSNTMTLSNPLSITSINGDILFNSAISGGQNMTLSTSGNITFNANATLGNLIISNANNFTNTATLSATSFTQNAGNALNFGSGSGLNISGSAIVHGNSADGTINAGSLSLGINQGTLFGTIGGASDAAAAASINLLNSVGLQKVYFNGVDLGVANATIPDIPQVIFNNYGSPTQSVQAQANALVNAFSSEPGNSSGVSSGASGCVAVLNGVQICERSQ